MAGVDLVLGQIADELGGAWDAFVSPEARLGLVGRFRHDLERREIRALLTDADVETVTEVLAAAEQQIRAELTGALAVA